MFVHKLKSKITVFYLLLEYPPFFIYIIIAFPRFSCSITPFEEAISCSSKRICFSISAKLENLIYNLPVINTPVLDGVSLQFQLRSEGQGNFISFSKAIGFIDALPYSTIIPDKGKLKLICCLYSI